MFRFLQRLGKSLMLPVSTLPVCALLLGIGFILAPTNAVDKSTAFYCLGAFMQLCGKAFIDNMGILFAIGVGVGLAKKMDGTAAIAALASWLVMTYALNPDNLSMIANLDEIESLSFKAIQNPLIGIIAGVIGSTCYNNFKGVKLPDFLAFFGGKRFVSIVSIGISAIIAAVLAFVWPICYEGLVAFGKWIIGLQAVGVGVYQFFNRLLLPVGMHHPLNQVFWQNIIGIGDLTHFWAGETSADVDWSLGMYMSGFFPCMMFGVPGAALAVIITSKKKKATLGIVGSMALCSFLCGVTEPFEFMFMFLAFPLYVCYAILFGIFGVITYYSGFRAGFSFSGGLLDLIFSASLPGAQNTWMIIPLGIGAFIAFFLLFYFYIKIFNVVIPGSKNMKVQKRLEVKEGKKDKAGSKVDAANEYSVMAKALVDAIGGPENVKETEHCVTRLRIAIVDGDKVNETAIEAAGANGVIRPSETACQIVIGPKVEFVYDEFIKFTGEDIEDLDLSEYDDEDDE